jgi:hypothetical protein
MSQYLFDIAFDFFTINYKIQYDYDVINYFLFLNNILNKLLFILYEKDVQHRDKDFLLFSYI